MQSTTRYQDPRPPAPPRYRILQALVNTTNSFWWKDGVDDMESPESLRRWLRLHGALEPRATVSKRDLTMMRDFREGLRALMRAHAGVAPGADALAVWNELLRKTGLQLQFDRRGEPKIESAGPGITAAIARMSNLILEATIVGEWDRFKACRRCGWAFYDRSRNRHGRWCRMEVCGNHVKSQAFRARKRKQLAIGA
jgi:predicted RNA-binding Zn ribbon-like protein